VKYLWICSIIFLIWQGYSSYAKLPERMATHFDASGNPNGWSSKGSFFMLWYLMILGMNLMWLLIPWLMRKAPPRMMNIPNRDYWLATDDRKEECFKRMDMMISMIAFLTNLMWSVIYHSIIQSNIETRLHFDMWMIFVPVGIMLILIFAYLLTAFRRPAASAE
jgi:uncharacterized membrane protein